MFKFFLLFIAVLTVLFRLDMLDSVQAIFIAPWTNFVAWISASVMKMFDADVMAFGRVIQSKSTGFGVSIEAGCNGVEAAIVLISGIIAFPSSWRDKFFGIALGIIAVQVANLLRVVTLFYLGKWNMGAFEFFHLYLWQALIMLDVLIVWLLWIRIVLRRKNNIKASL